MKVLESTATVAHFGKAHPSRGQRREPQVTESLVIFLCCRKTLYQNRSIGSLLPWEEMCPCLLSPGSSAFIPGQQPQGTALWVTAGLREQQPRGHSTLGLHWAWAVCHVQEDAASVLADNAPELRACAHGSCRLPCDGAPQGPGCSSPAPGCPEPSEDPRSPVGPQVHLEPPNSVSVYFLSPALDSLVSSHQRGHPHMSALLKLMSSAVLGLSPAPPPALSSALHPSWGRGVVLPPREHPECALGRAVYIPSHP